ncbi:DNA polymerase III subunit delta [Streptococcus sp. HMSC078D09]|uniref:DNA polymerase III subunit delta n=1 Tax=Streptococcus sp. HMSC078D09 TaxID=1739430 RepID=UPI0008A126F4|nr:DNA polymerase III subunit delta [Streptococcus sp. HMSC078D09]OFQ66825.1 DNA polymerase III subunit delta [Streptococcus sp. HMSC078D09]
MQAITDIKHLTVQTLPPILVLTGEDIGQFEWLKKDILKKIGYDPSDLNYSYFDMKEASYAEVELDLVSLPFFADEKIVILDHLLDLTTAKKRNLTDEDLKQFENYLENPSESTRLVIFAEGKLDSKRRLVKLLKRDAQIIEATTPKEQDLKRYFASQAQELGLQFVGDSLDQLLLKSGYDFGELQKNLALLQAYKEDGQITLEDIKEVVPKSLQDNIFDLTQMILKRQIDQARNLVKDLRLQGEDEIKLIAILLGQFRMFSQVKIFSEEGQSESQIVASLSDLSGRKVNPYQVKFALRDSRRLSLSFLKQAMTTFIETDYAIKSGTYEKDYLFDLALLKVANSI